MSDSEYIHGTNPEEQRRLSLLNEMLNEASLRALALAGGERILDVGCGLCQLTRAMARAAGPEGHVVGVDGSRAQLDEALRQARVDGEEDLVELRQASASSLPLAKEEWGSFDVAHARFLLEHVDDPRAVVEQMVRAVRPGGRVVLEDDDHELLRLHPEAPAFLDVWRAYYRTYEDLGRDPLVGRKLVTLLQGAGAGPSRNELLFFGACAGNERFEAMIENFVGVVEGARQAMLDSGRIDEAGLDAGITEFRRWSGLPDAALWYCTAWAEGIRQQSKDHSYPNRGILDA
jgi:ubiquinone/menaquinone biosynthesis C-methylase UbiE